MKYITKERLKAITSIAVFILVTINTILTSMGKSVLPFDEEWVTMAIAYVAQAIDGAYVIWKNHNFTEKAVAAQSVINNADVDGIPTYDGEELPYTDGLDEFDADVDAEGDE